MSPPKQSNPKAKPRSKKRAKKGARIRRTNHHRTHNGNSVAPSQSLSDKTDSYPKAEGATAAITQETNVIFLQLEGHQEGPHRVRFITEGSNKLFCYITFNHIEELAEECDFGAFLNAWGGSEFWMEYWVGLLLTLHADDGTIIERKFHAVAAAAGIARAQNEERWPKFNFAIKKLKWFWHLLLSPEPRRECILYIKKEWKQLSPLAQEDYISRGTPRDRVLDGTAYQSSSDPWRDVAEVCDEELALIEAMYPREFLSGSSAHIADSAKDSSVSPLLFEEVWHRQNGWKEQLQQVIGKLIELKLLHDQTWIGTRAELGFFIRDVKEKKLIVGRYPYKRIFEAGLSIKEADERGKLVVKILTEEEIKRAFDTSTDANSTSKRDRTQLSIELKSFLESLSPQM
jgi:hypothetical protein